MHTKAVHEIKRLFRETGIDKPDKFVHSLFLVGAAGDNADACAAHDTQRQHTQQALGVDAAFFLFHPDGGLIL